MFRQIHGADPTSSMPESDSSHGHNIDTSASATVPETGRPTWDPDAETRPSGLPPLPSFSSFARGQHHRLPARPRMRRRDTNSSSHKHKSATKPSTTQSASLAPPNPSLGPSFLQVQPPKSENEETRPRKRPFPLQDDTAETSNPSTPTLPSPPSSSHSLTNVAESLRDIEQLADNFSRHGFDLASRRSGGHSAKYTAPGSGSGTGYGHYHYKMADLQLRVGGNAPVPDLEVDLGGNAPVSDLEVDLGGNAPVDDLEVDPMCEPPVHESVRPATHVTQSLCSATSPSGPGSLASRNLERMQKSRLALSSSRYFALAQNTSPSTGVLEAERPSTVTLMPTPTVAVTVATAEAVQPLNSTPPQPCTDELPTVTKDLPSSPHFPICNAPSSSYDMGSWLESSSTVEVPSSLVAGTAGAHNKTSNYFATMAEARLPRRKPSGTHQQRPSPLKRVHTPPSYLDQSGPVDLANGPNPPVADLEVDMIGNEANVEVDICDSDVALIPDSPIALEAANRDLSPSGSSTDSLFNSVLASYLELKKNRSEGTADSRHVPLSQRIRMAHVQLEREIMLRQAGYLSDEPADAPPVAGTGDSMDVEMRDPLTLGLPSGGPSVMGGSWVEHPLSQETEGNSPQEGVRRYMGPFRYRLSSEVAMRCRNLVHSRPRMRRRRETDSKAGTSAGSVGSVDSVGSVGSVGSTSANDESVRESVEVESTLSTQAIRAHRSKEVSGRDGRHDGHNRIERHEQWPQGGTRERKNRVSRRRELARQSSRSLFTQAQAHIQARYEAGGRAFPQTSLHSMQMPTAQLQLPLPESPVSDVPQVDDTPSTV